jgi:ABC-type Fe3+ transport system substrate-binding protein
LSALCAFLAPVENARKNPFEASASVARLRNSAICAKLKRLYDAIENGIADLTDPMLKDRIAELKAIRDQARADTERVEDTLE